MALCSAFEIVFSRILPRASRKTNAYRSLFFPRCLDTTEDGEFRERQQQLRGGAWRAEDAQGLPEARAAFQNFGDRRFRRR